MLNSKGASAAWQSFGAFHSFQHTLTKFSRYNAISSVWTGNAGAFARHRTNCRKLVLPSIAEASGIFLGGGRVNAPAN